ncbi:MAG: head GIN domain-containing protein [Bacteroidota bacterium]
MKQVILILLGLILLGGLAFLSSCGCNGKRGNGHVVKQERKISSFQKISIKGIFPVVISQDGGSEWVKVEADDNLQELITVENDDNELIISSDDNIAIHKSKRLKVYVNIKTLHALNNTSVGTIASSGPLTFDSLEINSESVGKLELKLQGNFLRANLNSVGLTNLSGNVEEVRINNKSVGVLFANDLKAETLMIHNTAVGLVEVYAAKEFFIRSSGIGNLYYKGAGDVKELKHEGLGKVQKVE